MNILLLSGGSGKRLWPLSNEIRSKQFLKLFKNDSGVYESMVQRVFRQIRTVSPDTCVTVVTGQNQVSAIRNQLGDGVGICVEPARRDTFPAIALAAVYLKSERGLSPDDVVIVCPVDPFVDLSYFETLKRLETATASADANLMLMGVRPSYPNDKYGYIIPADGTEAIRDVVAFKEKPDVETAKTYLAQGALWNCGVFAFRLGYLLDIARQYVAAQTYEGVYRDYDQLPKTSFDYAVVEKEKRIKCIEFIGEWKDVGTWNTLAEEMDTPTIGNVQLDDSCVNVQAINELETPLLVMGAKNMVIAASVDGILVSDKERSSEIKAYVAQMQQCPMFEEKSWGTFNILNIDETTLTARLCLVAGRAISYHVHGDRDEAWVVLSGEGEASLDGETRGIAAGDVITVPQGVRHTVKAITDMRLIETQIHR